MPDSLWSKEPPTSSCWAWVRALDEAPRPARLSVFLDGSCDIQFTNGEGWEWGDDCEWCPVPTPEQAFEKMVDIARAAHSQGMTDGHPLNASKPAFSPEEFVRAALEETEAGDG